MLTFFPPSAAQRRLVLALGVETRRKSSPGDLPDTHRRGQQRCQEICPRYQSPRGADLARRLGHCLSVLVPAGKLSHVNDSRYTKN
jgi:hypothetical protein